MSLAITMPAGALMTLAVMKWRATSMRAAGSSPPTMTMYAAITLPAMVANPPTMMHMSCERVMPAMNGFTVSGASVCPRKMLAAPDSASAPLIPSTRRSTTASAATTRCMTPRW